MGWTPSLARTVRQCIMALLTGSVANANYKPEHRHGINCWTDIASGQVDILIGTHALIQEGVQFSRLGVAVVDEQHRFGVAQRVRLKEKAGVIEPDLLIMTATPIPRTMSMTMYGDLDVSLIDEMPPGRTPVETTKTVQRWRKALPGNWSRPRFGMGRQAFVVCPSG